MKSIKKLLREQAEEVLPGEEVKQNIKRGLGYPEEFEPNGGGAAVAKRRRALIPAAAVLLALALALAVFLPVFLSRRGATSFNPLDKFAQITDADSFYAYGALSAGTLLASAADGGTARAASPSAGAKVRSARPLSAQAAGQDQSLIGELNGYLSLVEGLLSEQSISEEPISPAEGYEAAMAVSYVDMQNISVRYELHYNKVPLNGESGEEREENYAIRGILLADGASYPAEGRYETEREEDGNETESESELYFRAYTGENSYIEVRQESESETEGGESENELEYVYTYYQSGSVTERISLSYEEEEGELELRMDIESAGGRDTLYFERESEDGEQFLSVRGTAAGQPVRFRIYIREGMYHYEFEDGSSSDQARPGHGDEDGDGDHDEDDDDEDDD